MTERNIADALEDLQREVEQLDASDQEAKRRLGALLEDIRQRVEADTVDEHRPRLLQGMKAMVTELEVRHPRITGIINEIMMSLSNVGI